MKKVIHLFLLIFLCFVLTSCKEEINYERYEKEEFLNEEIIRVYDEQHIYGLIEPPLVLETIDYHLELEALCFAHAEEETENYYLCGYLDNKIKKIVDKGTSLYGYLGREEYVDNWVEEIKNNNLSIDKNPIHWYKIPKTENIPLELKNKFLVLVFESVNINLENVFSKEIKKMALLLENTSYYNDGRNIETEGNLISNKIKTDRLISVYENGNKNLEKELILENTYSFVYLFRSDLTIEYYDDIAYVNVGNRTIYREKDLKEIFEYKEEGTNYLFKLEDLLSVIGK